MIDPSILLSKVLDHRDHEGGKLYKLVGFVTFPGFAVAFVF